MLILRSGSYTLPPVADVDLTLGADLPLQDLTTGSFVPVTRHTASRAPTPGSATAFRFLLTTIAIPRFQTMGISSLLFPLVISYRVYTGYRER